NLSLRCNSVRSGPRRRNLVAMTRLAVAAAPVVFVVLWSTGFIGARYGLPYFEPMTFLGIRMLCVVAIMLVFAIASRARWTDLHEAGHSLAVGAMVHFLYLGGVFVAISQGVPAGISALLPGLQPILTSTIANRFMGETVTRRQWVGLALGLLGVLLVLHDRSIVAAGTPLGWAASVVSLIGITLGTLYQKRFCGRIDWRTGNTVQYAGAGVLFWLSAFAFRDARDPLDRRTRLRHRVARAGSLDRRRGADVLADPPLGRDRLCKPVLPGARGDGADGLWPVRREARPRLRARHGHLRHRRRAGQSRRKNPKARLGFRLQHHLRLRDEGAEPAVIARDLCLEHDRRLADMQRRAFG